MSQGTVGDERPADPERLVVAQVRGLHGLKGGVRLEILTDDPARFEPGRALYLEGESAPLTIAWAQEDGPGILVRFAELTDRTSVEPLRERYLEADAPSEPLPAGTWYWHQLVGLTATDTSGGPLGRVVDVFRAGGGDVFVVRGPRGEVLVPAVGSVVRELTPAEGRLVVDTDALGLDEEEPRPRPRGRRTTRAHKARTAGATGEGSATSPASAVTTEGSATSPGRAPAPGDAAPTEGATSRDPATPGA
ncbi:MAG: 16S rRNA processing protein RimM [Chloroflexi bacterium]|nr:16S rRNA processing protein RimM [Chloroflexota bacterium]